MTYEVGTVVRIVNDFINFAGLVCVVERNVVERNYYFLDGNCCCVLKPLTPRPDGAGYDIFEWDMQYAELVSEDEARNALLAYELMR